MKTYSIPRHARHRARAGLISSIAAPAGSNYKDTFRGTPVAGFADLNRARAAARQTSDPLTVGIWSRVRPSPLVLAASFRDALQRMHEDGDKVAGAVLNAANDGRLCNPKLPGNFYAWRDKAGQVSYTPAGRELRTAEDGRWSREGRQETTPARFVRQVLRESTLRRLGDAALSAFAVRFRAAEEADCLAFAEWTGADIDRAYDEVRGTGSCMEGDAVGDFYARAGARVLVAVRNGSPVARAILWKTDDGLTLCDRVYAAREEDVSALTDEARRRGYWTKQTQTNARRPFVSPDGETRTAHTVTTPKNPMRAEYIPYLDSLCYWDEDAGTLSTEDDGATHECRCTNGTAEELGGVTLADGRRVDENDAVQDVDGDWRHIDDVHEVDGDYYPEGDDRITWCEHREEYILTSEARQVTIGRTSYIVHEDQIEQI
jgi:hypothetical protein